jgi:hypothetical protein
MVAAEDTKNVHNSVLWWQQQLSKLVPQKKAEFNFNQQAGKTLVDFCKSSEIF